MHCATQDGADTFCRALGFASGVVKAKALTLLADAVRVGSCKAADCGSIPV